MLKRLFYIICQRLYIGRKRKNECEGKVYMFHEISNKKDTYAISPRSFKSFLNYLIENKNIVDIETLINEKNENNVVLTFDDAYSSVYEYAHPLLRKYGVPYYIFICNDYLNKEDYLDEKMIKTMVKDSHCIIGSHGYYHTFSRPTEKHDMQTQLEVSKSELERKFNNNIDSFAFPYGSMYAVSKKNIETAKDIFEHVFMTYPLAYNSEYGKLIPRININEETYVKEMQ